VNVHGMTCYEGLGPDDLAEDEEEDYANAGQGDGAEGGNSSDDNE
jgi:hypothetical protein